MMARIVRTPQANDDLFLIWEYIARRNPTAADKLIRRFDAMFQTLAERPNVGLRQDRYRAGLRSFPVGVYVIFYLTLDDGIEVIRVLHGARDIPKQFPPEK
jgi:toxin ParE1/3/4